MTSEMDLLDDSWIHQEEVIEGIVGEQATGGTMKQECPDVGHHDQVKMESLEREVDNLRHCVLDLIFEMRRREPAPSLERPVKTFFKPCDIPVLELRQLSGVDGAGRLTVFLSQVESCSHDTGERQQIVQMRVDAPLALFIQNILSREFMSWAEFKKHLTTELTDQNEERIYDSE